MAVAQHEAVAIGPLGIGRVVLEMLAPQCDGHIGHAQGCARVTGLGLLYGIHRQRAQGVGHQGGVGHDVGGKLKKMMLPIISAMASGCLRARAGRKAYNMGTHI